MPRIGLVLGAGGSVGHAFHAGVLAGVSDATGWDARDAEVIVGTSAGAVVGALLRATISPDDLAARATDTPLSPDGRRLLAHADSESGELAADPDATATRAASGDVGTECIRAAVRFSLGLCASARSWPRRMPEGRVPTELVAASLRPLFDGWPEQPLWINAVALETGRHASRSGATRASCATYLPRSRHRAPYRHSSLRCPSTGSAMSTVACTPRRMPILLRIWGSTSW